MLHTGELLPPVGEVAEGVRAGEVWGGGSHLQGEHVVHHLTQTYITEERGGADDNKALNERSEPDYDVEYVMQTGAGAYDEMLVFACSCTSSPLGFTVKILFSGTPTSL